MILIDQFNIFFPFFSDIGYLKPNQTLQFSTPEDKIFIVQEILTSTCLNAQKSGKRQYLIKGQNLISKGKRIEPKHSVKFSV